MIPYYPKPDLNPEKNAQIIIVILLLICILTPQCQPNKSKTEPSDVTKVEVTTHQKFIDILERANNNVNPEHATFLVNSQRVEHFRKEKKNSKYKRSI